MRFQKGIQVLKVTGCGLYNSVATNSEYIALIEGTALNNELVIIWKGQSGKFVCQPRFKLVMSSAEIRGVITYVILPNPDAQRSV
jgi:hypothetical protein